MVKKMNPMHTKLLSLIIVIITILNFSVLPNSVQANIDNNSPRHHILAIYDSDSNNTVNNLFNDRKIINNDNLTINYFNIENTSVMNNLLSNNTLSQKYDEFWVISEKLDSPSINEVISHLLSFHIPTLIWSSRLDLLSGSVLNQIGLTSCSSSEYSYDNSILSFGYSHETNLTSLLNQTLPQILSVNASINIANCQAKSNVYNILKLNSVNSGSALNIPIVYQPNYKSNILIFPFLLDINSNDTGTDSTSVTSTTNSEPLANNKVLINTLLSKTQNTGRLSKLSALQSIYFTNFLSILTYSMYNGWSSTPTINSIFSVPASGISNTQSVNTINTGGFQFPHIDPQVLSSLFLGSFLVGLIALALYLLSRYWLVLIGFIIGILAVFKVPTRKISVMDVYHNETRQSIIDILNYRKGQGETVRNLARQLQIPLPTLLWHLQILEEFELVARVKVKREVVIIAMDYIEEFDLDLKIFELTFKSDKAKIFYDYLLNLKEGEFFSVNSVVSNTQWSSRTVIRYIVKLQELQIIETNPNKTYKIRTSYFGKLRELSELAVEQF